MRRLVVCAYLIALLAGCTTMGDVDPEGAGVPSEEMVVYAFSSSFAWQGQMTYWTHIEGSTIIGNVSVSASTPDGRHFDSNGSFLARVTDGKLIQLKDGTGLTTAFPEAYSAYFPEVSGVQETGLVLTRQNTKLTSVLNVWAAGLLNASLDGTVLFEDVEVRVSGSDTQRSVRIRTACQTTCSAGGEVIEWNQLEGQWGAGSLFPDTLNLSNSVGAYMGYKAIEREGSPDLVQLAAVDAIDPLPAVVPSPCGPMPCDGDGWPERWSAEKGLKALWGDPRWTQFHDANPDALPHRVDIVHGTNGVPGTVDYNDYTQWSIEAYDGTACGLFIVMDHQLQVGPKSPATVEPLSPHQCEPRPNSTAADAAPPYMSLAESFQSALGGQYEPENLDWLGLTIFGGAQGSNPAFHAAYSFSFPDGPLDDIYIVNAATGHLSLIVQDYPRRAPG